MLPWQATLALALLVAATLATALMLPWQATQGQACHATSLMVLQAHAAQLGRQQQAL